MKLPWTIPSGKGRAWFLFSGVVTTALVGSVAGLIAFQFYRTTPSYRARVTKKGLAQALGGQNIFYQFPTEMDLPIGEPGTSGKLHAIVQYSFDPGLQEAMESVFKTYTPDYGAFVAMDPATGRVLAMVSYTRHPEVRDNLALRATFPSASVFKVVTAAAAIQENKFSPESVIQFSGANHTLYRSNVLKLGARRWVRHSTLREAFAHSINTVFGRIGAFNVGSERLGHYAANFGFNRQIDSDLPISPGSAPMPKADDAWGLSQTASGFTRDNTMSPMQGALIASAIANDGIMMEPYVVQSAYSLDGAEIYQAQPTVSSVAVDPRTAGEIRDLMLETVRKGTSRKSFNGFFKHDMKDVEVGGKTGSLTGTDPKGKYDWFVGYASESDPNGSRRKIAFAALTIHEKLWRVKSSYLARRAIENYFQNRSSQPEKPKVVARRSRRHRHRAVAAE
jgi:cell division protein FtsI/penicillin-binding protein 2